MTRHSKGGGSIPIVQDAYNQGVQQGRQMEAQHALQYVQLVGEMIGRFGFSSGLLESQFARIDELAQLSKGMRQDMWLPRLKEHANALALLSRDWKTVALDTRLPDDHINDVITTCSIWQGAIDLVISGEQGITSLMTLASEHPINLNWTEHVNNQQWGGSKSVLERVDATIHEVYEANKEKGKGRAWAAQTARARFLMNGDMEAANAIPPDNTNGHMKQFAKNSEVRYQKRGQNLGG